MCDPKYFLKENMYCAIYMYCTLAFDRGWKLFIVNSVNIFSYFILINHTGRFTRAQRMIQQILPNKRLTSIQWRKWHHGDTCGHPSSSIQKPSRKVNVSVSTNGANRKTTKWPFMHPYYYVDQRTIYIVRHWLQRICARRVESFRLMEISVTALIEDLRL